MSIPRDPKDEASSRERQGASRRWLAAVEQEPAASAVPLTEARP
jgi:hypothetical protein